MRQKTKLTDKKCRNFGTLEIRELIMLFFCGGLYTLNREDN